MSKPENYQPGIKYPVVKSSFDKELAKHNYLQILQHLSSITVTRDNVNDDLTQNGREVLKLLDDRKNEESKEPLQWHRDIMEAYNNLKNPLKEQVERISAERKVVALQIQKEVSEQLAEQNRIANAKAAIPAFTNKIANLISLAKTDNDVVTIEKMIGSEKTKKSVYQEFLPELIEHCDGLRPQIKNLKESIRALRLVEEKQKIATNTDDIVSLTKLREEKEQLEAVIQETGIRIHEKAYEQAATVEIVAPEVVDTAPKGRSNWKWRVDDIKMLQKKMPHLVKLVPNEEAIDLLLTTMKKDGSLAFKMEEKWNGITFYNDKTFTK